MKRLNLWMALAAFLGLSTLLYAAPGTIVQWTGKSSRRNTVEMKLESHSIGTAADLTVAGKVLAAQTLITPPTAQTIAAGNTITADACGTVKRVTAAGAVTTSTSDTFTTPSSSYAGCYMILVNTGANNITLDNNGNFVSAGAADVVLGANDAHAVICDGSKWYSVSALLAN